MYSVCILIYVCMYLYSYLFTHGISGLAARGDWEQFEVWLKTTIEWSQGYIPRPWLSEFGDAIGDGETVNTEMLWEAMIMRVWRCTLRQWLSEFGDALWGRDRMSLKRHLEAVIVRTSRLWSSKFGDALGGSERVNSELHSELWLSEFWDALAAGYDQGRFEEYMAVVDVEAVYWRCTRCWDSIHRLVNSKPWEYDEMTLPWKLLYRTGWSQSICREVRRKLKLHSGVNSKLIEWRDNRQS